ncbi:hypothetical protein EV644_12983 [Kribbella orskensis]|uniref:Uncharacterized protein n=1 Tax=Kribbella orskensis TaxID=2512216 RepID=A0ABY2B8J7_9ACTN|nr:MULTISPECIES: hypothetical protein [Kribbella]TCN31208.1 hypothetical protein EV642_13183 [Kribbella sp. VKM Ac-2500]TCO11714.1 hypothetical protein EV644_12983 [Kribbella orskensis]
MTDIRVLQAEIARWEKDLAALEEERTAEGWTEPETLLFIVQRTIGTYRRQVLPRITAERALMLPALPDSRAAEALTEYSAIVADEINQLVDRLDELRRELVRSGQTAQLQLQATETLAGLRALGRVVLRFGQEVEIPSLTARLTPEQSDQLTTAVHAYEKDLR